MPPDVESLLSHAEFVKRMATRLVGDDPAADDIVQETYLAALRSAPPKGGRSRGWLAAVTRNAARMFRRGEGRRARHERAAARRERLPSPLEMAARVELHRQVVEVVLALDEPYRHTLLLRYFEDLAPREIAERTAVPVNTVRTRLNRGLARVRERLDGAHGGERRSWCLTLAALAGWPLRPPASVTAAASGSMVSTAAKGVVTMTAKTKLTGVFALLLCAALTLWLAGSDSVPDTERRSVNGGEEEVTPVALQPESSTEENTPAGLSLPDPVDFDRVDRDRDVHGVVVDPAGKPVAGASVRTFRHPLRFLRWAAGNDADRAEAGPETRTAKDGTFSIRFVRGEVVHVQVEFEGFARYDGALVQAGERLRIVLERGFDLHVEIRDENGKGLPGTELELERAWRWGDQSFRRKGTTDAEGRFVFRFVPRCKAAGLYAENPGYVRGWLWLALDRKPGPAVIQLRRGRRVEGRVTDVRTGVPISGALVRSEGPRSRGTETDADGRYVLDGLAVTNLEVTAPGYGQQQRAIGSRNVLNFDLDRGFLLRGRLVDSAGAPVPGAWVGVFSFGDLSRLKPEDLRHRSRRTGRSASDGTFAIEGLNGTWQHTLLVDGPTRARVAFGFEPILDDRRVMDLDDVRIPDAHELEIRLVTKEGVPIRRVKCKVETRGGYSKEVLYRSPLPVTETRFSDDLGRVRFSSLSSGAHIVTVYRPGNPDVVREVRIPAGKLRSELELRLDVRREVTIRVVDEEQRPVEGVWVFLYGKKGGHLSEQTDREGCVRAQLGEGERRFNVGDSAGGRRFLPVYARTLKQDRDEIRIQLREASAHRVHVVDETEVPVPGAQVELREGEKMVYGYVADAKGTFELLVPKGQKRADLRVTGNLHRRRGSMVTAAEELDRKDHKGVRLDVGRIVLPVQRVAKDRALRVRAVDPDGAPLQGLIIIAHAGSPQSAKTGADGWVRLEGLPGRRLAIGAIWPPNHPRKRDLLLPASVSVVPAGQEATLRFRRPVPLVVVVLRTDGTPFDGAVASVRSRGSTLGGARTDKDGSCTLRAPEGEESLLVRVMYPVAGRWHTVERTGVRADAGRVEIRVNPEKDD